MRTTKEHFTDEVWLDFVRQLPVADEVELRNHLNQQCPVCLKSHALWLRVASASVREPEYSPPESQVRSIKAAFGLKRSLPLLRQLAQAAQLVFDSWSEPLPAGVRGGPGSVRRMLHKAGEFLIDLRIETTHGKSLVSGQILHADKAEAATIGTGVVLVDEPEQIVKQTIADSLGEFQFECGMPGGLELYLEPPGVKPISVHLPGSI
jgi:hypothetical protein